MTNLRFQARHAARAPAHLHLLSAMLRRCVWAASQITTEEPHATHRFAINNLFAHIDPDHSKVKTTKTSTTIKLAKRVDAEWLTLQKRASQRN